MPKFSTLMGRFGSKAPNKTGNTEPRNPENSNLFASNNEKPAWQATVDDYLSRFELVDNDALPMLRDEYVKARHVQTDAALETVFHRYRGIDARFGALEAPLARLRANQPNHGYVQRVLPNPYTGGAKP